MNSWNAIERVLLGEVLLRIETGKSIQTTERIARDNELGVLKVSAVSWGAFNPKEAKLTHPGHKPEEHHRVRKGDVLISRANTVELVGAVVRVERDYPNRLLSDKTLRLVLDEERCDPDYIVQVLRLPEARAYLEENATGTSNSMRNVSQNTIRATPIRLPSIRDQKRIATKLRVLDEEIATLRRAIKTQLREVALLRAKLIAHVFES
jgi:type I restriction enzyme, S subunit